LKITLTEQDYAAIEREAVNVRAGEGNTSESYGEVSVVWVVREPERRCSFWLAPLYKDGGDKEDRPAIGLRIGIRCQDEIEKNGRKFRRRWSNVVGVDTTGEVPRENTILLARDMARCLVDWANELIDDYPEDGLLPIEKDIIRDGEVCVSAS